MNNIKFLFLLLFICSCAVSKHHYQNGESAPKTLAPKDENKIAYSLYLVGDVGDDIVKSEPVLKSLRTRLNKENNTHTGVAFLGDNLYPNGLRKKNNKLRAQDEQRLNVQIDAVKNFKGDILFIPGNHDWDEQGHAGEKKIKRQEKYIQGKLGGKNVFRPSHGCPGPEVIKVSDDLVIIILDTQWWIHKHEKPKGEKDGCEVSNTDELMVSFKEALKKNRSKNIVVLGHHPLVSNGVHGGYFPVKDHLFPLTKINKNFYIPLPVLGSIYPVYRKYIGHNQDIAHPVYADMATKIKQAINEYDNVIYAAGHEHNLQYIKDKNSHYVISGSGSKTTYVRKNKRLQYGAIQNGYTRLYHYESGEMWLDYITIDENTKQETVSYRKLLFTAPPHGIEESQIIAKKDYSGMTAKVTPDKTFEASELKRAFFGDLHRDLWTKELEVPYLNIHYVKGGLTPIKKGGGQQSISLRMEGGDGKQYVIRGIKKNSKFLIERNLRGTIAQDVIYDGIAGSHPYASVVIGPLADAAGVYHTNPSLVYVPKDPILGEYQEEFGGMFCLFEERPDGNMSHEASFGKSKKVLGYKDVITKTQEEYDHVIDYKSVLTARLLDMLIGDWDRHDDQWRWARFKKKGEYIYRPIPRDRDQAFFRFDGFVMNIANRKWMLRKFQPFRDHIRDISGLGFNARYFDRANLIEADQKDWINAAAKLQERMSDKVLEEAIKTFPKEGFDFSGEEIINTLKVRRNNLIETAERHYKELAKHVDIPGTFKDDYFELKRKKNGEVELNIYPAKKDKKVKKKRYYHRVFKREETKEIRLYGLDGEDIFDIDGTVKKSILVRIVAGEKRIKLKDKSAVTGLRKKTQVSHFNKKDKIKGGSETRVRVLRDENDHYEYNRKDFINDKAMPGLSIGTNPNDGFYIGPAFTYTKQGFKKKPFKSQHRIAANRTFKAQGYNIYYDFKRTELLGPFDFHLSAQWNRPVVYQFYGIGNEVKGLDDDFTQYNVRMNNFEMSPSLNLSFLNGTRNLNLSFDVRRTSFNEKPLIPMGDWETQDQTFLGASLGYENENKDNKLNPSRGTHLKLKGSWVKGLRNSPVDFFRFNSSLSFYIPLNLTTKQTVLAIRSGFARNFGTHSFFQSNFLDGFVNFRGVLRNRYAGNASLYHNFELRQSLIKVKTYTAPFDIGVMGHFDLGKVWEQNVKSTRFHNSYGAGAFINVLDYFMLMGTYSISNPLESEENHLLTIGTAFLF